MVVDKDRLEANSALHVRSKNEVEWRKQRDALKQARSSHENWSDLRRKNPARDEAHTWKRVTYALPRSEAQLKAREFLDKYPKAAYWSEVEAWRELPGDIIEFTMRRLPTAD